MRIAVDTVPVRVPELASVQHKYLRTSVAKMAVGAGLAGL